MIRLHLAALLALLTGCTEVDGPELGEETARLCPGGAYKRPSVEPHVVQAFSPCCDGSAHWMPASAVPGEFHDMLESNAQGDALCVPDVLATNAEHTPAKCTSLFGQPGACIPQCVASVKESALPLPRDVCSADERCAPCIDPRDGSETGACRLGWLSCETYPPETPCQDFPPGLDLSPYPRCCASHGGAAHCAPAALVSPAQQKDLAACDASGTAGFCVPDKFLMRGGGYTPRPCRSVGGREGRCLSVCVRTVQKDLHSLPQDVCDTDERCAPCYDPRTGYGTGACTVGRCDPGPSEPPDTFQPCGPGASTHALCVPQGSVPEGERCNFDRRGCLPEGGGCAGADELCVPRAVVDAGPAFEPPVCYNELTGFLALFTTVFKEPFKALSAMSEYREGRCLSRCLASVRDKADLLGRGSCAENEVCVPCYDPQRIAEGKIKTGACHRPSCPTPGP